MKSNKGLILLVSYIYVMIIVAIIWREDGMFWLPLITLMLIGAYESIKWRNKK